MKLGEELIQFLLRNCNSISHFKQIHAHILRLNLQEDFLTVNFFNDSIRALSKTPSLCVESLHLYLGMVRCDIKPDNYTYPFLLNSCAALSGFNHGAEVHGRVVKTGYCSFLEVFNALIDMYGKCSELGCSRKAFDEMAQRDVVSYNALLGAHARVGKDMRGARMVFDQMPVRNLISWNAMVVGYVNSGDLDSARTVFDHMSEKNVVTWTTMLVGYTKNKMMDVARILFEAMPQKTLVCWTAMISGYAQNGRPNEALLYFRRMQTANVKPDAFAMNAVISALAQLGRPDLANWIMTLVDQEGIVRNEKVLTSLVDMQAKCGNIEEACRLFEEIPQPDVYPYSALITGLASHGHGLKALEVFHSMLMAKVEPDYVTFVGVFNACSHAGLVEDGLAYWESMISDYKIEPDADHYACIVDMLGRAGRLEQAYKMLQSMPMGPRPGALGALLAACRTYNNIEIAELVAQELFILEPQNTGNYVLLSGIYAAREQWDEATRVRKAMNDKITSKPPGYSWVDREKVEAQ
ncbi:putative pentatricopeptide repeat-containing protein At5g37570 [Beta vulgaris subsp. vulgaris]|uniref:putative pentatricopeptide repeat-containing protein At5g37570 n=1 Tax=Beta vulgaris subsp. vulgaris TaxID=3555 RepID=UPI002036D6EB|nr:putative pentatricopeptide repeat-containing protein At5g37570 [Beta vulgaris subsp. vulgaris]XP_019105690.2 putative pentatricopeptide repeat-containing protein At5g37570 [Beta vulgaris subsp. vulgaris]XP_019105691.2 putative pentatricopeptide repeat-containing protein At5g37570 [Beta vulgaris subsp. vulgaris]XP_048502003.1 putative pentatricopeptide repeat-containing protein At5g37570 [Beta vulgaris subsp. vulgaris]